MAFYLASFFAGSCVLEEEAPPLEGVEDELLGEELLAPPEAEPGFELSLEADPLVPEDELGEELDELYVKNQREHTAIRTAIAAGSVDGARAAARDHVLHSGHLLEVILDQVEKTPRPTAA